MFHTIHSLHPDEVAAGNVREFQGDGTAVLKVPGLIGVPTRVRVGRTDLPLRVSASFIDNRLIPGHNVVSDLPLLDVQKDTDDTPILLRSTFSNDGIWQKGERIQIWGDWEVDAPASDPKEADAGEEIKARAPRRQKLATDPEADKDKTDKNETETE